MKTDVENQTRTYPKSDVLHPFDPLSFEELGRAVTIVQEHDKFNRDTRFVMMKAKEVSKEFIAGYKTGNAFDREVEVTLIDCGQRQTLEVEVSLNSGKVTRWEVTREVGQPMLIPDEFVEMTLIAIQDERVIRALEKRGLGLAERGLVCIDPLTAGHFGSNEDPTQRLIRGMFLMRKEANDNIYAHPIENLTVLVDMYDRVVVDLRDDGVVPIPQTMRNYERQYIQKLRPDLKPIRITQPKGVNFDVKGWGISWQRWRFHMSFNAREGLVLHDVRYMDEEAGWERPICFRASISEMTVPYCDVTSTNGVKNAFDVGEYGLGVLTNSLTLGCDCLGDIRYFDFDFINAFGEIESIPNAICMHEEDDSIMWKHTDLRTEKVENRRSTKLIVSFIATVGNYEYGFYWVFRQDGSLELEVKANGIVQTGAVVPGEQPRHGTLIEEGLYAPYHQHFFCARLDMNLDGPKNQVVEVESESEPTGPKNPRGAAFVTKTSVFKTEKEAQRRHKYETVRTWVIQNPNSKNRMGTNVGYRIEPTEVVLPFFNDDSSIAKRAGYLNNHLWVTKFDEGEMFAAGRYPNQNPGPDGLPRWIEQDRNIENEDIVVWYVFGHHHVPRLEDWPVMPNAKLGFKLKPSGFFGVNPAIDLPPARRAAKEHAGCCSTGDTAEFVPQRLTRLMRRTIRREKLMAEYEAGLAADEKAGK